MFGIELRDPAEIERDKREAEERKLNPPGPSYPWFSLVGSIFLFFMGLDTRGDGRILVWLAVWFFTFRHFDWRLRQLSHRR